MTLVEPLAHTLAGACLAESGLKRLSPLAASALIISANLADFDGVCYLRSADLAFAFRRGWTHGILALAVAPVLLTAALVGYDLGVLSHTFLDWLGNYGVRLLMPFSQRWFYGDTLFIVDPWLWLIFGAVVMLSWTAGWAGRVTAIAVALVTTLLMLFAPMVSTWARVIWLLSIGAWLVARPRLKAASWPRLATGALVVAAAYIVVMFAGSRLAERQVRRMAADRGWAAGQVAAMPVAAEPLRRIVIVVEPDRYRFVPVNWLKGPERGSEPIESRRGARDRVVEAALRAPFVKGVRRWLRFPGYEVRPLPGGGYRVIIRDARFAIGYRDGFGVVAIVDLDSALAPRPGPAPGR
jgi:inner membrane protein